MLPADNTQPIHTHFYCDDDDDDDYDDYGGIDDNDDEYKIDKQHNCNMVIRKKVIFFYRIIRY